MEYHFPVLEEKIKQAEKNDKLYGFSVPTDDLIELALSHKLIKGFNYSCPRINSINHKSNVLPPGYPKHI